MSFLFSVPLNALALSGVCLILGSVYFLLYRTALKRSRRIQGRLLGPLHFGLLHLLFGLQLALLLIWVPLRHPLSLLLWGGFCCFAYYQAYRLSALLLYFARYTKLAQQQRQTEALPVCPPVAVIIPAYQEPLAAVRMTLDSVLALDYPGALDILLVENTRQPWSANFQALQAEVQALQAQLPAQRTLRLLHNPVADTLKPGNLDLALAQTRADYVLFLDVDSTLPRRERLLQRALALLQSDARLALVHFDVSPSNLRVNALTRSIGIAQYQHKLFHNICSAGGFQMFQGHNGLWKKAVLDQLGSWVMYHRGRLMITEDLIKAVEMYHRGYYGTTLWVRTGEWVPFSLDGFASMWGRWTYGTLQVMRQAFGLVFWQSGRMTFFERLDLCVYMLSHLGVFVFILASLLLLWPLSWLELTHPAQALLFCLPLLLELGIGLLFAVCLPAEPQRSRWRRLGELYMGLIAIPAYRLWVQIFAVLRYYRNQPFSWRVTPKSQQQAPSRWQQLWFEKYTLGCCGLLAAGLCWQAWNQLAILPALLGLFYLNIVAVKLTAIGADPQTDTAIYAETIDALAPDWPLLPVEAETAAADTLTTAGLQQPVKHVY